MEGGREEGTEGAKEGGREGGRERRRAGGRDGGREGGTDGGREVGREGGAVGGREGAGREGPIDSRYRNNNIHRQQISQHPGWSQTFCVNCGDSLASVKLKVTVSFRYH